MTVSHLRIPTNVTRWYHVLLIKNGPKFVTESSILTIWNVRHYRADFISIESMKCSFRLLTAFEVFSSRIDVKRASTKSKPSKKIGFRILYLFSRESKFCIWTIQFCYFSNVYLVLVRLESFQCSNQIYCRQYVVFRLSVAQYLDHE